MVQKILLKWEQSNGNRWLPRSFWRIVDAEGKGSTILFEPNNKSKEMPLDFLYTEAREFSQSSRLKRMRSHLNAPDRKEVGAERCTVLRCSRSDTSKGAMYHHQSVTVHMSYIYALI
jgi:hypothetical protein